MDTPSIKIANNLHLTAIDHLPSLLPRESSHDFCDQLFPHFVDFLNNKIENSPWEKALETFYTKTFNLSPDDIILEDSDSNDKIMM